MQNPHNRRSNERARTAPGPTRIGYRHADRLISYPHTHSLSISQQPIRIRGRFRRSGRQAYTERTGRSAGGQWRGLAGQRGDAPSEARGADGERAGSHPRAHRAARPTGQHVRRQGHQRRHKQHNNRHHTNARACKKPTPAIGCRPVVELGGFEPPTFSLRTRRATNCAIAPRTDIP